MDSRTSAQNLFLKLLEEKGNVDGKMINMTAFFNSAYSISTMKMLAEPFVERFKDSRAKVVVTAPASGIPLAHEVAEGIGAEEVFFPRKGRTKPKNLIQYDLCERQVGSPDQGSPTGGAENLYFRRDLLDDYHSRGWKALIIDDVTARSTTAKVLYDELKVHHKIEVVGMGILLDKGMGGLGALRQTTGLGIYCLLQLSSRWGILDENYSALNFSDPLTTINVRNQKTAVTAPQYTP
jgi:adenine/guanine phosphoribosyltransferase-like PRPP-binding protein